MTERRQFRDYCLFIYFFRRSGRTYEVVVHGVLGVVLRDGVFPVDYLQLGPLLEWVLLETQQVEDASEGLSGKQMREKTINTQTTLKKQNKTRQNTYISTDFAILSLELNPHQTSNLDESILIVLLTC